MHSFILVLNKNTNMTAIETMTADYPEYEIDTFEELKGEAFDKALENVTDTLKASSSELHKEGSVISLDTASALQYLNKKKREIIESVIKSAEAAETEKAKYTHYSGLDLVRMLILGSILVINHTGEDNEGGGYLTSLDDFIAYSDENKIKLDIKQIYDYHF